MLEGWVGKRWRGGEHDLHPQWGGGGGGLGPRLSEADPRFMHKL